MIRRDYLERMIEEVAAAVAKAFGLAREGRHDDAMREIESGYAVVGLSVLVLDRLDAEIATKPLL